MSFKTVFKRYEFKYIISASQKEKILSVIKKHMHPDEYGRTTIRNLYFDTDSYLLIRRSIEKPVYKEKLRIRSYKKTNENSIVFAEIKKKYKSVVYKRRLSMAYGTAMKWFCEKTYDFEHTQISDEINYFLNHYDNLHPRVYLSYEREAYCLNNQDDFRITFDENILVRNTDLSLESEVYGTPILDSDTSLMEIKSSTSIPLWLVSVLSEEKIYKTPFSKYGTAYRNLIFPNLISKKSDNIKEEILNVR